MEILQQTKPKAIKDHKCDWCSGIISKGQNYHYSTQVHDGDIYSWKSHEKCMKLAHTLKMFDECGGDGVSESDFYEIIYEAFCDILGDDDKDDNYSFQEKLTRVYEKHCL